MYSTTPELPGEIISALSPLAVAYSGGVDSTLLLKIAHDILKDSCIAITIDAPYHLRKEIEDAKAFTTAIGVRHIVIPLDPATVPGLMDNPPDRCYLCKHAIIRLCLSTLTSGHWTLAHGPWTLTDGSNLDDLSAHRPGRRALLELGVRSPLAEAGLTKEDIRRLSLKLGLETWNKPAQSCLLTRFPYGTCLESTMLQKVERAEVSITGLGLKNVRVRSLPGLASIECDDPEAAKALLPEIVKICVDSGFSDVEIDPSGYRSGSMEVIPLFKRGSSDIINN